MPEITANIHQLYIPHTGKHTLKVTKECCKGVNIHAAQNRDKEDNKYPSKPLTNVKKTQQAV